MGRAMREMLIVILAFGLIFAGFIGCIEDINGGDEQDEAPGLPPDSSMTLDMPSFFDDPSPSSPGQNFLNAAARVLVVETTVGAVLAAPAAVFAAAKSDIPEQQADGSWLWRYTVTAFGYKYEANLVGRMEGLRSSWTMRVSNNARVPPLEDFLWYSGESEVEGKSASGAWRFFDLRTPNEMNEIGTIDWLAIAGSLGFQDSDEERELVFTNTDVRSPNLDDTLLQSFEATDEGTIGLIQFYDASERMTAEVRFNVDTMAGSLRVPDYNDGRRACWDENLRDITCPLNAP